MLDVPSGMRSHLLVRIPRFGASEIPDLAARTPSRDLSLREIRSNEFCELCELHAASFSLLDSVLVLRPGLHVCRDRRNAF